MSGYRYPGFKLVANRIVLSLVFALSFLVYLFPVLTPAELLAPLILFAGLVAVHLLFSGKMFKAMWSLLEENGLWLFLLLPALSFGPSVASRDPNSIGYWMVLMGSLILARLYMVLVPMEEVFEAFFWAGILSLALFIFGALASLTESLSTFERLWAFSFHPNLLGWTMEGFCCIALWKLLTGKWRMQVLAVLAGGVSLVVGLLSSSRGALVGLLGGLAVATCMGMVRLRTESRRKFTQVSLAAVALILVIGIVGIQGADWLDDVYDLGDKALALSTADRGINSGLTGRVDKWMETIHMLADGTWLLGHGVRSSDNMETMIDNSYLVILYDLGLVPAAIILWRFASMLRKFVQNFFRANGRAERRLYLVASTMIAAALITNIVERSLLAVGNPFSLLVFLLFAAPPRATALSAITFPKMAGIPRRVEKMAKFRSATAPGEIRTA